MIKDIRQNIKNFDNIKKIQFHNLLIHIFYSFCNIKYLYDKDNKLQIYINTYKKQFTRDEEDDDDNKEEDQEIYLEHQKNIVDKYSQEILFLLDDYVNYFIEKLNIKDKIVTDKTVIPEPHIIINGTTYSDWSNNPKSNEFNIIMDPDGCKDITGKVKDDFNFDNDVKIYQDFFLDKKDVKNIYLYEIINISINKGKEQYIQILFTHIYNRLKEIKYISYSEQDIDKYIFSNNIIKYKDAINEYYGNNTYDIIYDYLIRCLNIILPNIYNFEDKLKDQPDDDTQNIYFKYDDTWNDEFYFNIFIGIVSDDNKINVSDSSKNTLLEKYNKDDDIDDLLEPLLNITILPEPDVDPPNVDPLKVDLPDNIKLFNKQFIIHCYQMLLHHMLKYDKYSMNNMDEKTYLHIMDKMTKLLQDDVNLSGGHFYEIYIKNKKNYEIIRNINETYFYDLYVKNKSMYISLT